MKVVIDEVVLQDLWYDALQPFEENGWITEMYQDLASKLLTISCSKYFGCRYIGDWDNITDCIAYVNDVLRSRISQNIKYFLEIYNENNPLLLNVPSNEKIDITKDNTNDTFTLGEISPINSPSIIPNIKGGATGIDTPNTKNRGQLISSEADVHIKSSPDTYMKLMEIIEKYPNISEIAQMIFESLVYEYSQWY